ncbi:MAG: hypothetical protein PHW93_01435 [Candidatus Methanomethylophilaceae archaeon]|nr:hypothetical protein [Candidatus Methanomethylophilaceae archaeon]
MTRSASLSTKINILLVFLNNDNRPLNVSRLARKMWTVDIMKFTSRGGQEADFVEPSRPAVSDACQVLLADGMLESIQARPPRSSSVTRTPHYHLPSSDPKKVMKTIAYLLKNTDFLLINSRYGQTVALGAVMEHLLGVLDAFDIKLTSEEYEALRTIVSESPASMRRILSDRFVPSLMRVAGYREDNKAMVEALIIYLKAARIMDIADGSGKKPVK